MRKIFLIGIMILCAVSSWCKAVIFEYTGPDGHTLRYYLQSENSKSVRVVSPSGKVRKWVSDFVYEAGDYIHNPKNYNYESIVIPEKVEYKGNTYTVTVIEKGAFYEESSDKKAPKVRLKRVVIPKTIERIGLHAFCCADLEQVHVTDLKAWCNISFDIVHYASNPFTDGGVYSKRPKLYVDGKLVTQLVIPDGVKEIEGNFSNLEQLESVTIPISVERIGSFSFSNCKNLKKVVLPPTLKKIDSYAFRSCGSLRYLMVPEGVESIGTGAFEHCCLVDLKLPSSLKRIEHYAFHNCKALESVIFGGANISLDFFSFEGCKALKKIVGLSSVSVVHKQAFDGTLFSWEKFKTSFSYYAGSNILKEIERWQKKGEFETTEQWRERVTEDNRRKKLSEVSAQLRKEYVEKYRKSEPPATIGIYNADQSVFPIVVGDETVYVKVPQNEAQSFKAGFKSEYINTRYDVVNDHISVVGRTCKVGNKSYEITNQYAKADNLNDLAINLPPLEMDFGKETAAHTVPAVKPKSTFDRSIDQNIPVSDIVNSNTFAVIIGNENYSMVARVPHAKNDAQVVAEYCRKTLGIPAKNVRTYGDATYAMMMNAVKDIKDIAEVYGGNIKVLFYYAGHGIPDDKSKESYLLPVDADGRQVSFCYPVSRLYEELGSLKARSVVVLMDACFSGALRGDGMLMSARGVAIKAKTQTPQGNMVVITAASGDETAYPYEEKGHGMFTYFLLKKLQETKGSCTLGELSNYIDSNVRQQSVVVNRKKQTPTIASSASIADSWRTMKLK